MTYNIAIKRKEAGRMTHGRMNKTDNKKKRGGPHGRMIYKRKALVILSHIV